MISAQAALNRLIDQNELFYDEMLSLMRQIMRGEISPELIAAILVGLRVKVESVSEICAAATVMREFATHVPVEKTEHLIDIVGTGGDKSHTFNISTTSMFIAAAAGARIAKHGNRAVSSSSGSADVIEALGLPLDLTAEQVGCCIDEVGLGFMFAPNHHSAMRHVANVRRELGVRTIFNILGPLTNPADAPNQLMGVFHADLVGIQARVLQQLGSSHVMVVHGKDGLDEITLTGNTLVAELRDGEIQEYEIDPRDYGFELIDGLKPLQAKDAQLSRQMLLGVLDGETGPQRDIVLLNAGAALYCADVVNDLRDGIDGARDAIDSGRARKKLDELLKFTQSL